MMLMMSFICSCRNKIVEGKGESCEGRRGGGEEGVSRAKAVFSISTALLGAREQRQRDASVLYLRVLYLPTASYIFVDCK